MLPDALCVREFIDNVCTRKSLRAIPTEPKK